MSQSETRASARRRVKDLRAMLDGTDPESGAYDDPADQIAEYPLSIEKETVVRIVIGTGGPHDEFRLTCNKDGEVLYAEYRFMDWGTSETVSLTQDETDTVIDAFGEDWSWL